MRIDSELNDLLKQPDLCKDGNHNFSDDDWKKTPRVSGSTIPNTFSVSITTGGGWRRYCRNPGCSVYEESSVDPKDIEKEAKRIIDEERQKAFERKRLDELNKDIDGRQIIKKY
jgi:hypothetical protein